MTALMPTTIRQTADARLMRTVRILDRLSAERPTARERLEAELDLELAGRLLGDGDTFDGCRGG